MIGRAITNPAEAAARRLTGAARLDAFAKLERRAFHEYDASEIGVLRFDKFVGDEAKSVLLTMPMGRLHTDESMLHIHAFPKWLISVVDEDAGLVEVPQWLVNNKLMKYERHPTKLWQYVKFHRPHVYDVRPHLRHMQEIEDVVSFDDAGPYGERWSPARWVYSDPEITIWR